MQQIRCSRRRATSARRDDDTPGAVFPARPSRRAHRPLATDTDRVLADIDRALAEA